MAILNTRAMALRLCVSMRTVQFLADLHSIGIVIGRRRLFADLDINKLAEILKTPGHSIGIEHADNCDNDPLLKALFDLYLRSIETVGRYSPMALNYLISKTLANQYTAYEIKKKKRAMLKMIRDNKNEFRAYCAAS